MDAKGWGIHMYKVAVLAALMLAVAALPTTSNAAAKKEDPAVAAQKNTSDFLRDAMNPYEATMPKSVAKKGKRKKM